MKEELKYELIESYLNGELLGQALTDFEQQLKTDTGLKAEVELHRDISIAMLDKKDIPFVQTMNEIHKEAIATEEELDAEKETDSKKDKPPGRIMPRIIRYAAIAAAAALMLAFFGRQFLTPEINPVQLSESTISAPTIAVRSSDVPKEEELLRNAYRELDAAQYSAALTLFDKITTDTPWAEAAMGKGYAQLQLGNYDKAAAIFKNISQNNTKADDDANWYLAHTYLRNGKKEACAILLEEIILAENVTPKREKQAKELLKSIR